MVQKKFWFRVIPILVPGTTRRFSVVRFRFGLGMKLCLCILSTAGENLKLWVILPALHLLWIQLTESVAFS